MSRISDQPTDSVLVFEKQPHWGPELQRQLAHTRIVVRECRSLRDLLPFARTVSSSVILVDLDAAPAESLSWLSQHFPNDHHPPVLVIASEDLRELEWSVREAGAAAFIDDEISGASLALLCLRQFRVNAGQLANS